MVVTGGGTGSEKYSASVSPANPGRIRFSQYQESWSATSADQLKGVWVPCHLAIAPGR
jgi:hypothetical protein